MQQDATLPQLTAKAIVLGIVLAALNLDYRAVPRRIDLPPYHGRKVAVIEGPAGE